LEVVIHFKIKSPIYFEKQTNLLFFRQQNLATLGGSGVV